jgi:hypothetical protein
MKDNTAWLIASILVIIIICIIEFLKKYYG